MNGKNHQVLKEKFLDVTGGSIEQLFTKKYNRRHQTMVVVFTRNQAMLKSNKCLEMKLLWLGPFRKQFFTTVTYNSYKDNI